MIDRVGGSRELLEGCWPADCKWRAPAQRHRRLDSCPQALKHRIENCRGNLIMSGSSHSKQLECKRD